SAARGQEIKRIFDAAAFNLVPHDRLGLLRDCKQADEWHRARVLDLVDAPRIGAAGFRALLDANGGAGGPLGKALLDSLQARPIVVGGEPDGNFVHPPEPLAENLTTILPLVPQHRASVGFVLDPDSDRLAIIDER